MSGRGLVKVALVLSLCLSATTRVRADALDDFYIQQVLDRYYTTPNDVQGLSLAGASIPVCGGAACLSNNPAGLGWMSANELYVDAGKTSLDGNEQTTGAPITQNTTLGSGVLGVPLGATEHTPKYGTLGLGFSRYQGDTDDSVGTIPDGHRRSIGYGYALTPTIALGYGLTFYDDQLNTRQADLHSHARFLHIFGAQYKASQKLLLGATFQLGVGQADAEDYTLRSDGLARPREYLFQIGARYGVTSGAWYGASRIRFLESPSNFEEVSEQVFVGGEEEGYETEFSVGFEYDSLEVVKPRIGVRYRYVDYTFERENARSLSGTVNEVAGAFGLSLLLPKLWDTASAPRFDIGLDVGSFARGWAEGRGALIIPF
jgi:hypothetical protein